MYNQVIPFDPLVLGKRTSNDRNDVYEHHLFFQLDLPRAASAAHNPIRYSVRNRTAADVYSRYGRTSPSSTPGSLVTARLPRSMSQAEVAGPSAWVDSALLQLDQHRLSALVTLGSERPQLEESLRVRRVGLGN